jgi:hypothetical protein
MGRKYSDRAAALARASGSTPGEVEDYLARLEAAGHEPDEAADMYERLTPSELEDAIGKGGK